MSTEPIPAIDEQQDPHEAKAQALLEEADTARDEARLHQEFAQMCRRRATALLKNAQASEAVSRIEDTDQRRQFAIGDCQRATHKAELYERMAERHDQECARAGAEAQRAEAEAMTARSRRGLLRSHQTPTLH